jgi:hypothetical protein
MNLRIGVKIMSNVDVNNAINKAVKILLEAIDSNKWDMTRKGAITILSKSFPFPEKIIEKILAKLTIEQVSRK